MKPIYVVPRDLLAQKPPHGAVCTRCGLCCMVALCDLAQHVFRRPDVPGPCPALVQKVDGGHACGMVVQPSRFAPEASCRYGEDGMRAAALLLINAPAGCDLVLRGEPRNAVYDGERDAFDREHAAEIAGARMMWGKP